MLNHKVIQSGDGNSRGGSPVKEYYEVFGLPEGASLEEVTARYMVLKKQIIGAIEKGRKPFKTIQEINDAYMKLKQSKLPVTVNFDLEEHLRKSITSVREAKRKARKRKIILTSSVLAFLLIVGVSLFMLQNIKEALPPGSTSPEGPSQKAKGPLEGAGTFSALEPKTPEKTAQVAKAIPKEPGKPPLPEKAKPAAPKPYPEIPPVGPIPTDENLNKKGRVAPPAVRPAPSAEVALAVPQKPSRPTVAERAKPVDEGVRRVEPAKPVPQKPAPPPPRAPQEMRAKVETPVVPPPPKAAVETPVVPPPPKAAVETPVVPLVPPPPKPAPPVEVAKAAPQEPSKTAKPESARAPEPVREKEQPKVASTAPSAIASDLEVRNFFDNYLVRYNRKEINGFIALFSAKAIQNQKDDVGKIRRTYEKFFDQMESVNYQIAITEIEPKQDRLEVKAQYELEGIVAKGRKTQSWKGQVRWVLVRERGALKILSLDYQPSGK